MGRESVEWKLVGERKRDKKDNEEGASHMDLEAQSKSIYQIGQFELDQKRKRVMYCEEITTSMEEDSLIVLGPKNVQKAGHASQARQQQ